MTDLVRYAFDYRVLVGKRYVFGHELSRVEDTYLCQLQQMFALPAAAGGRRGSVRFPLNCSATLHMGQVGSGVTIIDVGNDGVGIRSALPLGEGQRLSLRYQRGTDGTTLEFSARVCWRRGQRHGLIFQGVPRAELGAVDVGRAQTVPGRPTSPHGSAIAKGKSRAA